MISTSDTASVPQSVYIGLQSRLAGAQGTATCLLFRLSKTGVIASLHLSLALWGWDCKDTCRQLCTVRSLWLQGTMSFVAIFAPIKSSWFSAQQSQPKAIYTTIHAQSLSHTHCAG